MYLIIIILSDVLNHNVVDLKALFWLSKHFQMRYDPEIEEHQLCQDFTTFNKLLAEHHCQPL